jgi:hypothetical protein
MSSFQPPLYDSDVFNSSLFDYDESNTLTIYDADRRYLKLSGGLVNGFTTFNAGLAVNGGLTLDGSAVDLSVISGITNGIGSANKALVLDSARNINNINALTASQLTGTIQTASQPNITSLGTLTAINLNGSFNFGSNVNTTMNNNLIITGSSSSPTSTNGIGMAFNPFISTGRIKAYNYVLSSFNSIDINEGALYIKADKKVAIGSTSPNYTLDVATGYVNSVSGYKLNGSDAITASGITGMLLTGSQPNITSLGTLTGLTVGNSSSSNEIHFSGTTGDANINHTVIAERIYGGTEQSELYLFKGNDYSTPSGPDRIRLRGANIVLQTYNAVEDWTTTADNNSWLTIDRLGITTLSNTTEATAYNTASITLAGGLGVAKKIITNSNVNVGTKLRIGSTTDADFTIHCTQSANDRILALYNTSTGNDFYGFGANGSGVLYHSNQAHRWYLGSTGTTTGTKYMDLSTTLLTAPALTLDMALTGINTPQIAFNGTALNHNYYLTITEGGAVASKAMVLNSDKDYSGVRTFSAVNLNASTLCSGTTGDFGALKINSVNCIDVNKNANLLTATITSTTASTSTTTGCATFAGGIGVAGQVASAKCGTTTVETTNLYLGGYQAICNGQELSKTRTTADGVVYANKCMITDSNNDIGTVRRFKATQLFLANDFTDTGRIITALDSTTVAGNVKYVLTGGQANSTNNSFELSYYHSANGSNQNQFRIGYNGGVITQFRFDGTLLTGAGTAWLNSSGEFIGKVNTSNDVVVNGSGRLRSNSPLGVQIYNSDYNDTEGRIYCGSYNMYVGTQGNGALRLITGGNTLAYFGGIGSQNISFHGTSTSFPVSIQKADGISSSSYGYINSGGNTGTASNASSVSLYTSGRILCTGECDCISDRRVKRNIDYIKNKFVERFIHEVKPKCFEYKQETILSYGYIAQELIKAGLSRFVQLHNNDELLEEIDEDGFVSPAGKEFSINSAYFIPLLHMKVKELTDDIEDMKKCIKEQAEMIHTLIEKLNMFTVL